VCAAIAVGISAAGVAREIRGTPKRDILKGTSGTDRIFAGAGNDIVLGQGGNDILVGGDGSDRIGGGPGDDVVHGYAGNDSLVGGPGRDELRGGPGNDRIVSKDGVPDRVSCGPGNDTVQRDAADIVAADCETVRPKTVEPPLEPKPGTTIVARNRAWICDRPLSEYGTLPILVEQTWEGAQADTPDSIGLRANCTGDDDPATIDLILHVNGDGRTFGGVRDAVKVGSPPGTVRPHDIQIAGYADCGPPAPGAHQDAIQIMSGERITFHNFRSGDVGSRAWTCRGAGGAFFVSGNVGNGGSPPNGVICVRCAMVASNHGLLVNWSVRSGARDSTFVGRLPLTISDRGDAQEAINVNNTAIRHDR
jgi:Ca2+-binding RTX toxin-like protein